MRAILAFMLCSGLITSAMARDCRLFADPDVRLACWDAEAKREPSPLGPSVTGTSAPTAAQTEMSAPVKPGLPLTDQPQAQPVTAEAAQASPAAVSPAGKKTPWPWEGPDKPAAPGSVADTRNTSALDRLSVNDKLDAANGSGKGASFGLTTADGQTAIKSSVAATYKFPAQTLFSSIEEKYGWNAGVGGQWTKDNSTKSKVDGRMVRLFASGLVPSMPVLASIRLDGVDDNVTKERTVGLRANAVAVPDWSQWNSPYDSSSTVPAYDIYFSGGPNLDRITYAKAPNSVGNAAGLNGRVDADFFPNGLLWHFHVFGTVVRARDLYAETGRSKRSSTYYDFGLEWAFLRPDQKGKGIVPALSLHRTIGSNFLDGTARAVTTSLVLTLKSN